MADFSAPIDGRKLAVRWSRAPAGGTVEDQAQISMHFVKTAAGAKAAWADGVDDLAVENLFATLWNTLKTKYSAFVHLDVYRWYRSSELLDVSPAPFNPAYRTTEVDVAGSSAADMLPPQTAVSVTFKTTVRKRWGRVYLPSPISTFIETAGRIDDSEVDTWLTAWQVFLNGCTSADIQPCVMSRAHPAYTTDKGHAIAEQPYTYYGINQVQMDNLTDVIRSRRYAAATKKVSLVVTPAS